MGPCGMPTPSLDRYLKGIGVGTDKSLINGNHTGLEMGVDMTPEYSLNTVEHPLADQLFSTVAVFLGRLENKLHPAGAGKTPLEKRGGAQQHRHMAIVAAGMHDSFVH